MGDGHIWLPKGKFFFPHLTGIPGTELGHEAGDHGREEDSDG